MNPRQRQGVLLLVLAAIGLIVVFALIASYVSSVSKQVGPVEDEVVLTRTVKPYTPITSADLGSRQEPQRWAARNVMTSPSQAIGQVSQTALQPGTVLQSGMVSAPSQLPPGDQEFTLSLSPDDAVDGQIKPESTVDIIGVFSGGKGGGHTRVVVPNVKVLNTASGGSSGGSSSGGFSVILALTPEQVLQVEGAKSWASDLALSLVQQGTKQGVPGPVTQGSL
ncbi:MAG: Flp pilus assembly protein CpaB [Solirubrobacterales bacterium]|nr:Flp pilus assembly protein CpaB [Solirubrobacterales bacterium]